MSVKNRTQVDECRGANETIKTYEVLGRGAHDDDHGNYMNVPQASNLYAALEFSGNEATTEEQ